MSESLTQGPCWIRLETGDPKCRQAVSQEVLNQMVSLIQFVHDIVCMLIGSDSKLVFRLAHILSATSHTKHQVNTVGGFVGQRSRNFKYFFIIPTHYPF